MKNFVPFIACFLLFPLLYLGASCEAQIGKQECKEDSLRVSYRNFMDSVIVVLDEHISEDREKNIRINRLDASLQDLKYDLLKRDAIIEQRDERIKELERRLKVNCVIH